MRTDCDEPLVAIVQNCILNSRENPGGEAALDVIMERVRAKENKGLRQAYELKQKLLRSGREAVSTGTNALLEIRDQLRGAGIV
jgi:hypothetical protein